jgi:hypothetical protein
VEQQTDSNDDTNVCEQGTNASANVCSCTHPPIHPRTHTYTHIHIHTHTHSHPPTHTHTTIHTHKHTHSHTQKHTHAHEVPHLFGCHDGGGVSIPAFHPLLSSLFLPCLSSPFLSSYIYPYDPSALRGEVRGFREVSSGMTFLAIRDRYTGPSPHARSYDRQDKKQRVGR